MTTIHSPSVLTSQNDVIKTPAGDWHHTSLHFHNDTKLIMHRGIYTVSKTQSHKKVSWTCSGNTCHTNIFIHVAGREKMEDPHKIKPFSPGSLWPKCGVFTYGFWYVWPCLCRV